MKRGFLLAEETLKIIVALICLGFLAYFLASLYFANQTSEELEQAEASLNNLIKQISSESEIVEIFNPEDWAILSWPYEGSISEKCSNSGWESCLCFCETPILRTSGNYLDNCNGKNTGVCLENQNDLTVAVGNSQLPIIIENPPIILSIDYENKIISEQNIAEDESLSDGLFGGDAGGA